MFPPVGTSLYGLHNGVDNLIDGGGNLWDLLDYVGSHLQYVGLTYDNREFSHKIVFPTSPKSYHIIL